MGLYQTDLSADFSASPGKQGTLALPTSDPLPVMNIPGLTTWLSAEDAVIAGTVINWLDRQLATRQPTPTQPSAMPATNTVGGKPSVYFNTAGMLMPANTVNVSAYHWMFILNIPNIASTGGILGSHNTNLNQIRLQVFNDGTIRATNSTATLTTVANASTIASGVTYLVELAWDSTNRFTCWVNGTQRLTGVGSVSGPAASTQYIGAIDQTVSNGFRGHLQEILLFNRNMSLVPGDLENLKWLRRRLGAQYGLTIAP